EHLARFRLLRPDQPGHCPGRYSFIAFRLFVVFVGGRDLLVLAKFLFVGANQRRGYVPINACDNQATPSGVAFFHHSIWGLVCGGYGSRTAFQSASFTVADSVVNVMVILSALNRTGDSAVMCRASAHLSA